MMRRPPEGPRILFKKGQKIIVPNGYEVDEKGHRKPSYKEYIFEEDTFVEFKESKYEN